MFTGELNYTTIRVIGNRFYGAVALGHFRPIAPVEYRIAWRRCPCGKKNMHTMVDCGDETNNYGKALQARQAAIQARAAEKARTTKEAHDRLIARYVKLSQKKRAKI